MIRILKLIVRGALGLVLALFLVACAVHVGNSGSDEVSPAPGGALRVASYNVHYIRTRATEGAWSLGDWERRKAPLDAAFKAVGADLVAFQEMESFGGRSESQGNLTLDYLLAENPDYAAAAVADPAEFPSTQPILYRPARLEVVDQGWFFFSETPDVIYSRTFNGSWPAFASTVRFRDRTDGAEFVVLNVHFEYRSRSNRYLSAELVAERIGPWIDAGVPVILIGDLNARLGSRTHAILEEAGLSFAPVSGATYHFNRGLNMFGAIDHVAVSNGAEVVGAPMVIREKFLGEWPTDHYPVIVDLALP